MQETLLVCSKSTKKFLKYYKRAYVVDGPPKKDILDLKDTEEKVVAIGGGAVIDTAKIISKTPIVCYPTTAAGSSKTSHSVCWDGTNKLSLKRMIPSHVYVVEEFVQNLPADVVEYTTYDALSHCLDSMWSKNSNKNNMQYVSRAMEILEKPHTNYELILAGNLAGQAIEICPTTILHSMSYPLTAHYGISHGKALGFLLPRVSSFMEFDLSKFIRYDPVELKDIDFSFIANETLKYNKVHDTIKGVDVDVLVDILSS
jgi:alcohol dehydrogenase class IV